jgi:hypothetical protein
MLYFVLRHFCTEKFFKNHVSIIFLCGEEWYIRNLLHEFTIRAVRTKATQIVHTQDSPHMPVSTRWTMPTEASIIPANKRIQ